MATFGFAGGGHVYGTNIAMPTIYNVPTSFLGGGIKQGNIKTGDIVQSNKGYAEGGKLDQSASLSLPLPIPMLQNLQ